MIVVIFLLDCKQMGVPSQRHITYRGKLHNSPPHLSSDPTQEMIKIHLFPPDQIPSRVCCLRQLTTRHVSSCDVAAIPTGTHCFGLIGACLHPHSHVDGAGYVAWEFPRSTTVQANRLETVNGISVVHVVIMGSPTRCQQQPARRC